MDLLSCSVAINGDIRAVITKPHVTIPEIVLLQAMHGADAVTNIKVIGELETTSEQERDRLGNFYKDAKVMEVFGQYGDLPKTLAESRIEDTYLILSGLVKRKRSQHLRKKPRRNERVTSQDTILLTIQIRRKRGICRGIAYGKRYITWRYWTI